jgi:uncharacterized membrane protein SpoIIM required for sporulation
MNVDAFVADRSPVWNRLEQLVGQSRRSPERLGPDGVRELGLRYRETVADLAFARRRFSGDPIVARIERLVTEARHLVYDSEPRRGALRAFVSHGYWRRIRERPVPLLVAVLFLFAPALLAGTWAWRDPGAASGLVPSQYQRVTEPRPSGTDLGVSVSDEAALASQIFTNNITVTMLAFGGGLLLGLGTLLVLVQNGVLLGAVAGLSIGAGNGRPFFSLVTAHGVLELSCICVAAAAGLRIGWAIVEPGYRRRGDALRTETRAAVEMLLGTAPWLVVAGLVEGFVTPAGLALPIVVTIGLGLGALFWGLVLWRGGDRRAQPTGRQ